MQDLHLLALLRTEIGRGDCFLPSYPQHFPSLQSIRQQHADEPGNKAGRETKKRKRGLLTFFETMISAGVFFYLSVSDFIVTLTWEIRFAFTSRINF